MGAAAPYSGGTVQAGRFTPEGSIPSPPTLTLTHNSYMRRRDNQKRQGLSYMRRVAEVNGIYDKYVRTGQQKALITNKLRDKCSVKCSVFIAKLY